MTKSPTVCALPAPAHATGTADRGQLGLVTGEHTGIFQAEGATPHLDRASGYTPFSSVRTLELHT